MRARAVWPRRPPLRIIGRDSPLAEAMIAGPLSFARCVSGLGFPLFSIGSRCNLPDTTDDLAACAASSPLLLVASLACVLVLVAGIASGGDLLAGADARAAAADRRHRRRPLLWARADLAARPAGRAREARVARSESADLKRSLAAADSIIRSEPQILVFWEQGQPLRIVAHT